MPAGRSSSWLPLQVCDWVTAAMPKRPIGKLTLRPVKRADEPLWRRLHRLGFKDVVVRQFGGWNDRIAARYATRAWVDPRSQKRVVVYRGKDIGWLDWAEWPREIFLAFLVIHPDYQNRGLGGQLLRLVEALAILRGARLRLRCLHKNRAKALYRRHGFVVIRRTNTYVLMEWRPQSR